jgi:predicted signal transduction protein with EAL and GGDEF domain
MLVVVLSAGALVALVLTRLRVPRQRDESSPQHQPHDSLTGLPNRSSFMRHAKQALGRAAGRSRQVAVLVIDLDDFEKSTTVSGTKRETGCSPSLASGSRRPRGPRAPPPVSAETSSPSCSRRSPTQTW